MDLGHSEDLKDVMSMVHVQGHGLLVAALGFVGPVFTLCYTYCAERTEGKPWSN